MSDLERLVDLYKSFGVELNVVENAEGFSIELEAGTHEKIKGYVGFCTEFVFNKEGKFIVQWIGE